VTVLEHAVRRWQAEVWNASRLSKHLDTKFRCEPQPSGPPFVTRVWPSTSPSR